MFEGVVILQKIITTENFKLVKNDPNFYVVITDTTGRKIHSSRCGHVDISHFRTKVVHKQENGGKPNGEYYCSDDFLELMESFKPQKCEECKKRGLF